MNRNDAICGDRHEEGHEHEKHKLHYRREHNRFLAVQIKWTANASAWLAPCLTVSEYN